MPLRDEFLSDEDLDLRSLTEAELYACRDLRLRQAQATNDLDRHSYSHGVFSVTPEAAGAVSPGPETAAPASRGTSPATDAGRAVVARRLPQ